MPEETKVAPEDIPFGESGFPEVHFPEAIKPLDLTPKTEVDIAKKEEPEVKTEVKEKELPAKPKIEEPEVKENDKKEEPKIEEPSAKEEDFTPQPLIPRAKKERDFSGLDETETNFGKKMDHTAFEFYKARILDLKREREERKKVEEVLAKNGGRGVPDSYYEHEAGFLLDPDYQAASQAVQSLQNEKQLWEEQLLKVKDGEDWIDFQVDNGKVIQVPFKASKEAEVYLMKQLSKAEMLIQQHAFKAQEARQSFKAKHLSRQAVIKDLEQKYFPVYAAEGDKFFETNKFAKGMKNLLKQSGMENNPLNRFICYMYALVMDNAPEKETEAAKVTAKVKASTGPSTSEINNGTAAKGKLDPEDIPFEQMKHLFPE